MRLAARAVEQLSLFDGEASQEVVCGATDSVKEEGGKEAVSYCQCESYLSAATGLSLACLLGRKCFKMRSVRPTFLPVGYIQGTLQDTSSNKIVIMLSYTTNAVAAAAALN